jgi:hypothetical protein
MAYPIQPKQTRDYLTVTLRDPLNIITDLKNYLVGIDFNQGSVPDPYFAKLQPGLCSVKLWDCASILSNLKVGNAIQVSGYKSAHDVYLYYGRIRDVMVDYELDPATQTFKPRVTLTVSDEVADLANSRSDAYLFTGDEVSSSFSFDSVWFPEWTSAYTTISRQSGAYTSINSFSKETDGLTLYNAILMAGSEYLCKGNNLTGGDFASYTIDTPASYNWLFTDGTHTGSVPASIFNYTAIDQGYSTSDLVNEVSFNNWGLNHSTSTPGVVDRDIFDVDVLYSKSQTSPIGVKNSITYETVFPSDNLGWNLLHEDGTGAPTPTTWATTTNTTWKISRPSKSVMSLNSHYVYRCKVTAAAGAAVGSGFLLDIPDPEYDFVTTFPGGATSTNWIASVKIRVTTQRTLRLNINWYDANGNSTGTTTGTNTVINTGSWTTLSTQCSTANVPANSVTAVPVIVTNVAIGQYGYFFASEAMLTRTGVSSTFFNGDTDDDASYCYTWTGTPYQSPSQKNVNTMDTALSTILARNTVVGKVKSVTVNAFDTNAWTYFTDMFKTDYKGIAPDKGVKVCVNGTISTYLVVGYEINAQPESLEITFNLASI